MLANTQPLDSLAAELWDFVGIAPEYDLPALWQVSLSRQCDEPDGWKCRAAVKTLAQDSAAAYQAVAEYARFAGTQVVLGEPYKSGVWPSGTQRTVSTTLTFMGVAVEVAGWVDGDFTPPPVPEPAPVVPGSFAELVGEALTHGNS